MRKQKAARQEAKGLPFLSYLRQKRKEGMGDRRKKDLDHK